MPKQISYNFVIFLSKIINAPTLYALAFTWCSLFSGPFQSLFATVAIVYGRLCFTLDVCNKDKDSGKAEVLAGSGTNICQKQDTPGIPQLGTSAGASEAASSDKESDEDTASECESEEPEVPKGRSIGKSTKASRQPAQSKAQKGVVPSKQLKAPAGSTPAESKPLPQRQRGLSMQSKRGHVGTPLAAAEPDIEGGQTAAMQPATHGDVEDDLGEEISEASQRRKQENIKAMLGQK